MRIRSLYDRLLDFLFNRNFLFFLINRNRNNFKSRFFISFLLLFIFTRFDLFMVMFKLYWPFNKAYFSTKSRQIVFIFFVLSFFFSFLLFKSLFGLLKFFLFSHCFKFLFFFSDLLLLQSLLFSLPLLFLLLFYFSLSLFFLFSFKFFSLLFIKLFQ